MKLSVIIPCHNGAAFLPATLTALAVQTRLPDAVIVVDDASTDDSAVLAEAAGAQVVRGRFGGAPAARLAGLAQAEGSDALMFLDADDLPGPTALAHLAATLERAPDAVAVCPWNRLEPIGEGENRAWVPAPPSCAPRRPGQDSLSAWLTGWYHPPCSVLWSRTAYERSGGWDATVPVNNDGDVMMRGLIAGNQLVPTSGGMAYYRRLPGGAVSLSGTRHTRRGTESRLFVLDRVAALLAERGRLTDYGGALSEAYGRIAAEGAADHPDLAERALAAAERHGGPQWRRRLQGVGARLDGLRGRLTGAAATRLRPLPAAHPTTASAALPPAVQGEAPLVSVIIPTFNRSALLRRALDSVQAQTWPHWEALVVDDGSTEDIGAVVASLDDDRMRVLRQPVNGGVAAARNRGLAEARGAFIGLLDSDDEWLPDKLAWQIALLHAAPPRVGVAVGGVETVWGPNDRRVDLPRFGGDIHALMLARNILHGSCSNVLLRREVVAVVGGFDTALPAIEDYDFLLRVTRFFEVAALRRPVLRYHDERGRHEDATERRSLNIAANMQARALLHARCRHDMAAAGVEHRYLLDSARRAWEAPRGLAGGAPGGGKLAARRLVMQALRARPTFGPAWALLLPGLLRGGRGVPDLTSHTKGAQWSNP